MDDHDVGNDIPVEETVDPNRISVLAAYNALFKKFSILDNAFTDSSRIAEQEILNKNDIIVRQKALIDKCMSEISRLESQVETLLASLAKYAPTVSSEITTANNADDTTRS